MLLDALKCADRTEQVVNRVNMNEYKTHLCTNYDCDLFLASIRYICVIRSGSMAE